MGDFGRKVTHFYSNGKEYHLFFLSIPIKKMK